MQDTGHNGENEMLQNKRHIDLAYDYVLLIYIYMKDVETLPGNICSVK